MNLFHLIVASESIFLVTQLFETLQQAITFDLVKTASSCVVLCNIAHMVFISVNSKARQPTSADHENNLAVNARPLLRDSVQHVGPLKQPLCCQMTNTMTPGHCSSRCLSPSSQVNCAPCHISTHQHPSAPSASDRLVSTSVGAFWFHILIVTMKERHQVSFCKGEASKSNLKETNIQPSELFSQQYLPVFWLNYYDRCLKPWYKVL